jgi:hypothetical protein
MWTFKYSLSIKLIVGCIQGADYFVDMFPYMVTAIGNALYSVE